ncbi:NAD(P)-dependent oxidoreductase [Rhabdobacter roseus]|uniref:NAD(P)-binding domain-containing protein n=1 Tax=Rhabdobacter roseus TaxID=1655419 RepID=A0A840TY20_9BACT|nr:NAD(P)-dependent oxidoreductase [Rhabdobacter roseus]MBB5284539.1 hypothetical protein [Rhabdobacter roseus]
MKIALVGASGYVGTSLLNELLERGHQVTAIARDTTKITTQHPNLTVKESDVNAVDATAEVLQGHDAVVSTFNAGWTNPNLYQDFLQGSESIQEATRRSGVKRLLVVGGAGSLEIAPGLQLVDSPDFPEEYKAGASSSRDYLAKLRQEQELDWTFLSPAIMMHPGISGRTGQFRIGTEQPVFDEQGQSQISAEDLSVALADELEKPQFSRSRFTVGY